MKVRKKGKQKAENLSKLRGGERQREREREKREVIKNLNSFFVSDTNWR
jgi:hypothetical protein